MRPKPILLTGCRRHEIGSLKWSEIDLKEKTITLPPDRTKNKQTHVVPLSANAIAIIEQILRRANRDFVFGMGQGGYSGWSKSKAEIDKVAKLKDAWTMHDLRRTVRTGLGKLNVQPHIAEAVLNHLPPKLIRTYRTILPVSSTMQTLVSLTETSSPAKWSMLRFSF
jgi:integrase